MKVETGALVYAILHIITVSISSVASLMLLVYACMISAKIVNEDLGDVDDRVARLEMYGFALTIVSAVLLVALLIAFSFGIVLLVGLCKRKAHLVKVYYIYGIVKIVLGVSGNILSCIAGDVPPVFMLLLLGPLIYGAILYMIRLTYKKFEMETNTTFTNPIHPYNKF